MSNMWRRDIPLVLKSRVHFHDELGLGSPDHCSKPSGIETRGPFRADFSKEKVSVLNTKLTVFQMAEQQNREGFFYSCRQTVDLE